MQANGQDFVVLGDLNLDWLKRNPLSYPFTQLSANGVIEWDQIDELPGGSGLNFARFAQQVGFTSFLLGKVGKDPAGRFLTDWLEQHQLRSGVLVDDDLTTGKAIIVRDNQGIRLLVNNTPNANRALSVADVEQYAGVIAACKILYISGYCVMDIYAPRTQAVKRAMQIARESGHPRIVFDVVPHQFYKIYSFAEFLSLTSTVDVLISEVATMRRFLELGNSKEIITRSLAETTADQLTRHYGRLILRFGPSGCDEQLVLEKDRISFWEESDYALALDKRGFGDVLTLRALQKVFKMI